MTDLQEATRLMEDMALEYEVVFDLDGDAAGWRCGAWRDDDYREESMLLIARTDMPASETPVEAVKLCVAKLAEMHSTADVLAQMAAMPEDQQLILARILGSAIQIVEQLPEEEIDRRLTLLSSLKSTEE